MTHQELRALLAFHGVMIYGIAPKVGLHPARLGQMLNGRVSMPADIALKIKTAIEQEATAKGEMKPA